MTDSEQSKIEQPKIEQQSKIIDFDINKLEDATTGIAKHIGPLVSAGVRRRVYSYVSKIAGVCAAAGASALLVAPVVGGEIGSHIALAGAIATVIGSSLAGAATELAKQNT